MASQERLMRTIRQSTARRMREVTNLQTIESTKQDLEKDDTLNKLLDRVVSEEHQGLVGHRAKKVDLETVKTSSARDAFADRHQLC